MNRHPTATPPQRARRASRGSWPREVIDVAQLMVETAPGNRTICRPIGDLDMIGAKLLRRSVSRVLSMTGVDQLLGMPTKTPDPTASGRTG